MTNVSLPETLLAPMRAAAQPMIDAFKASLTKYVDLHTAYNGTKRSVTKVAFKSYVDSIPSYNDTNPDEEAKDNYAFALGHLSSVYAVADKACMDNDAATVVNLYRELLRTTQLVKDMVIIQHNREQFGTEVIDPTDKIKVADVIAEFDSLAESLKVLEGLIGSGILSYDYLAAQGIPVTTKERQRRNGAKGDMIVRQAIDIPGKPRDNGIRVNSAVIKLVVNGEVMPGILGDEIRKALGNSANYDLIRKEFVTNGLTIFKDTVTIDGKSIGLKRIGDDDETSDDDEDDNDSD